MKIEVLISTMHQNIIDIFSRMNISSDALVVNQCDSEYKQECIKENDWLFRVISLKERGLSRSRNLAIQNSEADICVLADDDLVYTDNYVESILKAYYENPDADVIAFSVPSTNEKRQTKRLKRTKVGIFRSMKLASFQLTFRRKKIVENKIAFNTMFGAGATYICGEENIFLIECLKKGLKIIYKDIEIASVSHAESTWFQGFNSIYFKTKGAMFYQMSTSFWRTLILQYALRKYGLYRSDHSFGGAMKDMLTGGLEYKGILLRGKS